MQPEPRLRPDPDWAAAAQLLVDGCAHAPDAAWRVDLVERLCLALGDALYPAFLNVLCVVGERGTPAAQAAVADALVDALRSGRLPAGRRAAWGAAAPAAVSARGQALGPLEYLCAWYAEPQAVDSPSAPRFEQALRALLALVSQSPRARTLYAARLHALAEAPMDGTLSRGARSAMHALADAWCAPGAVAATVADATLRATGGGLRGLLPAGPR